MAPLTVASGYGPLTLRETDEKWPELPNLQFEDADMVIKLDSAPESWLLVHRDVIRTNCPVLSPGLSGQWEGSLSGSAKIKSPLSHEDVRVWCRALKQVDDTYVLEDTDFLVDENEHCVLFQKSILSLPGWPCDYYTSPYDVLGTTKRALRILFALLYGAQLTHEQITGEHDERYGYSHYEVLGTIVAVCSYAEFWGCLGLIGPRILRILQSSSRFWESVADAPKDYLMLAIKLENAEVYYDALRHLVAQAHYSEDWRDIGDISALNVPELQETFEPQFKALDQKLVDLNQNLHRLHLLQIRTTRSYFPSFTRSLDVVPFQTPGRVDYLARSAFGEWLAYRLSGEKVSYNGRNSRSEPIGSFNKLIMLLEQGASSTIPSHVMDAATSVRIGTMFNFSPKEMLELRRCLDELVVDARDLVEAAFPVLDQWESVRFVYQAEPSITRRAYFDAHQSGYFTYLAVPIILPWTEGEETPEVHSSPVIVPDISTADISTEWLQALEKHFSIPKDKADEDTATEDEPERDINLWDMTAANRTAEDADAWDPNADRTTVNATNFW